MLIRVLLLLLISIVVLLVLAGQAGLLGGKTPSNLGANNGKLKPPSPTENSVSSQASLYPEHPQRAYAEIKPIGYIGDAAVAWGKLEKAINSQARTAIIVNRKLDSGQQYIYAQCQTLVLRFTDDVEFLMDEQNKVIHVRSASRLGRKDFGVNRARIESIRSAFNTL